MTDPPILVVALVAAGLLGFGLGTVLAALGCLRRSGPGPDRAWLLAAAALTPLLGLLMLHGIVLVLNGLMDWRRFHEPATLALRILSPLAGLGLLVFATVVAQRVPPPDRPRRPNGGPPI